MENFFTEYCRQKGFSYRKRRSETIEITTGITCISKRTLECSHSYVYKPRKIDDTSRQRNTLIQAQGLSNVRSTQILTGRKLHLLLL